MHLPQGSVEKGYLCFDGRGLQLVRLYLGCDDEGDGGGVAIPHPEMVMIV